MIKNCSACKGRHEPPYGQYCKHVSFEYCVNCVCRHEPPVGPACVLYVRSQLFINSPTGKMSRATPISDQFKDRSDPDYLIYLEEQVESLKQSKREDSDISQIVQRLEALELAQERSTAAGGGGVSGAVGGTGSTAVPGLSTSPPGGIQGSAGRGGGLPGATGRPPLDPSLLPLTDALAQLTLAVDPAAGKAKGLFLRPEYHFQHVKSSTPLKQIDHTKLDYKDLVYGWFCVIEHLLLKGGDLKGYLGHCKFVADQATSGSFVDSAFVNYDRHVVSKVVDGLSDTFIAGDIIVIV